MDTALDHAAPLLAQAGLGRALQARTLYSLAYALSHSMLDHIVPLSLADFVRTARSEPAQHTSGT